MINLLKNILNHENSNDDGVSNKNLELICGLMIEAAFTDGKIEESELKKITHFGVLHLDGARSGCAPSYPRMCNICVPLEVHFSKWQVS